MKNLIFSNLFLQEVLALEKLLLLLKYQINLEKWDILYLQFQKQQLWFLQQEEQLI